MSNKNQKYVLSGILLITALVFANSLCNGFIENLDDQGYVLNNEIIKHLDWNSVKTIFSTFCLGNYHPLTLFSYALDYKFFGLNPFFFHLTNYILHLLNTLLVYLFIKRFTGKFWVAIIVSLFFGIHPMHVESVAWISERKDVLYTFFFLLSLISYVKYIESEKKKSYLILTFIWFLLSLLSKPAAVCLPLVLVLMDYYYKKRITWQILINKAPFFIVAMFFAIIAVVGQRSSQSIYHLSLHYNILDRMCLINYSIVFYLVKIFAPFNLSVIHYYPTKSDGFLPLEYYFVFPFLVLLIWAVLKSGNFKRELIFGLLFFLITIVEVLQIIPIGGAIVSERYSYVPYIGTFFIIGQFFSYIKNNELRYSLKIKPFITYTLLISFILCFFATYERNKIWKNGETLFTDTQSKYPNRGENWYELGLSRQLKMDFTTAKIDFSKAIQLAPYISDAYFQLGIIEGNNRNLDTAIMYFNDVLVLDSNNSDAYFDLAQIKNEKMDFLGAINEYNQTLKLNHLNSFAYYGRGLAKLSMKYFTEASADFSKAIELKANFADAYFNRGVSEFYLNNKKNACQDWQLAEQYGNQNATVVLNQYCK